MKQRKKQPDQTRQRILDAVDHEFSRKGYTAAGLGGIIAISGLTKGALFHHFADKRALCKAWIEERIAPAMTEQWHAPLGDIQGLDALRKFSHGRFLALDASDPVSALTSVAAEVGARDEILAEAFEQVFGSWRAALAATLERGKQDGWIYSGVQPELEAAMLVSLFAGFSVTAKIIKGPEISTKGLTALEGYIETLRAQ